MSLLNAPGIHSLWAGATCILLRIDSSGAWIYEPCSSVNGKPVYRWHYGSA